MTLAIKTFQNKYQTQIVELITNIQQHEFNIDITVDQQPDLKNIPEFYQKGNGNFWIALDDNRAVGTIALLDIGHNEAALRKMFVHEDYRGKAKGVAKKLLGVLLAWAKERGIDRIYLGTTPAFFAAHRFYEKNGFVEIFQDELPKSFQIMAVDTKFYRYDVM